MQHCPRCGAPIPHDRTTCWACGAPTDAPVTETPPLPAAGADDLVPARAGGFPPSAREAAILASPPGVSPPAHTAPFPPLAPELPADWRVEVLPDGGERIRLSPSGVMKVRGGNLLVLLLILGWVLLPDNRFGSPPLVHLPGGVALDAFRLIPGALIALAILVYVARAVLGREEWIAGPNRLVVRATFPGREWVRDHVNGTLRIRVRNRYRQASRVQLLVTSEAGEQVLAVRSQWSYPTVRALGAHLAAVTGWALSDEVAGIRPNPLGL